MSNKMHNKTIITVLLICLGLGPAWSMGKAPKSPKEYTPKAIDFTLPDINGKSHRLSDYKGKLIFLNFWATWCPPCRAEMPSMQKMYEASDKNKFIILAVNVGEPHATVKKFAETHNYTFPILIDDGAKTSLKYRAYGIPLTYIIDQKGEIIARISGAREWDYNDLKRYIK